MTKENFFKTVNDLCKGFGLVVSQGEWGFTISNGENDTRAELKASMMLLLEAQEELESKGIVTRGIKQLDNLFAYFNVDLEDNVPNDPEKKAFLVTFSPCVRVVLNADATDDDVITAAVNKLVADHSNDYDWFTENVESVALDLECPALADEKINL